MMTDLAEGVLTGLAYGVAGIVLLLLGYVVIDVLTPGNLRQLIYTERNTNAALVLASGLIAIAAIVTTAIVTSADEFKDGIASALGYGFLGVVLLGVSFVLIDKLTPGKLGVICTDPEGHPAVFVTVASHLALGAIVAAAIS